MKRIVTILTLLVPLILSAQTDNADGIHVPVDHEGTPVFQWESVTFTAKRPNRRTQQKFEKKVRKFNRLRYNVMKVWPYANEAAKNLTEINHKLETLPEDQHKKYLRSKEDDLFGDYEKELRDLSVTQGKILVKLIDRQTGSTTHSLISDLKNNSTAFFWSSIGKVFGYDLKKEYDPNQNDAAIELICQGIESGRQVSYYDYLVVTANMSPKARNH